MIADNNNSYTYNTRQQPYNMIDPNQLYIILATTMTGLITTMIMTSVSMIKDGIYLIGMKIIEWFKKKDIAPNQHSYTFEFKYNPYLADISTNQQIYQNIV